MERISQATIDGEGTVPEHYIKETAPVVDPNATAQEQPPVPEEDKAADVTSTDTKPDPLP